MFSTKTDDGDTTPHSEKAGFAFARFMAVDLKDEAIETSTCSSRTLAEENTALRQENADLKEQLRLTTQQLSEAMAALGRAMEYIQLGGAAGVGNQSPSNDLLSEGNGVEEVAQTLSHNTSATAVVARGQDECGAAPTTSPRADDKPVIPLRSQGTRPVHSRTITAHNHETDKEKPTKSLADLYDEWTRNMFIESPKVDILQREVWELHQNSFPAFAPGSPLCKAEALIQHIPTVFPRAKLMSVGTLDKKYIVRGITRK